MGASRSHAKVSNHHYNVVYMSLLHFACLQLDVNAQVVIPSSGVHDRSESTQSHDERFSGPVCFEGGQPVLTSKVLLLELRSVAHGWSTVKEGRTPDWRAHMPRVADLGARRQIPAANVSASGLGAAPLCQAFSKSTAPAFHHSASHLLPLLPECPLWTISVLIRPWTTVAYRAVAVPPRAAMLPYAVGLSGAARWCRTLGSCTQQSAEAIRLLLQPTIVGTAAVCMNACKPPVLHSIVRCTSKPFEVATILASSQSGSSTTCTMHDRQSVLGLQRPLRPQGPKALAILLPSQYKLVYRRAEYRQGWAALSLSIAPASPARHAGSPRIARHGRSGPRFTPSPPVNLWMRRRKPRLPFAIGTSPNRGSPRLRM
ncbi:hypothetical protein BCR34DRAFT_650721 [Clohesyomyces aquaticus]|uniref:Uncharacterized protein n=1 Tax=Clohesyomyces aquaticus TaxID=1231657 RepID=A0A1Y2A8W6_9PLEO|nr:hypothetical protein BCR34DRAFT_650721 [Clohesyomyces aquaticus]